MNNENELQIRPLETIEVEINFYKQQTAIGIFEIGKRLIEAKEQLPHGEWGKWLEKKVEFTQSTATRFMKCYNEYDANFVATHNLGTDKLFKLLTVPAEERDEFISQPHEVNGQVKTVDDMTTRELQQAIKEKKELEKKNQQYINENEKLKADLQAEKDKPKEEIIEEDYLLKRNLDKVSNELEKRESELQDYKERLEIANEQLDAYKQDSEDYQKMKENITYLTKQKDDLGRHIQAITDISSLVVEINNLIKEKLAPVRYSKSLLEAKNDAIVIENLSEIIEVVQQWCDEMKGYIPNKINYVEVVK